MGICKKCGGGTRLSSEYCTYCYHVVFGPASCQKCGVSLKNFHDRSGEGRHEFSPSMCNNCATSENGEYELDTNTPGFERWLARCMDD